MEKQSKTRENNEQTRKTKENNETECSVFGKYIFNFNPEVNYGLEWTFKIDLMDF